MHAKWMQIKFLRKTAKHTAWVLVALLTSLTFVGYFTPVDELFIDFVTFNTSFWAGLSVIFFAVCTYGNAGYMREIMCTHICPYASTKVSSCNSCCWRSPLSIIHKSWIAGPMRQSSKSTKVGPSRHSILPGWQSPWSRILDVGLYAFSWHQ